VDWYRNNGQAIIEEEVGQVRDWPESSVFGDASDDTGYGMPAKLDFAIARLQHRISDADGLPLPFINVPISIRVVTYPLVFVLLSAPLWMLLLALRPEHFAAWAALRAVYEDADPRQALADFLVAYPAVVVTRLDGKIRARLDRWPYVVCVFPAVTNLAFFGLATHGRFSGTLGLADGAGLIGAFMCTSVLGYSASAKYSEVGAEVDKAVADIMLRASAQEEGRQAGDAVASCRSEDKPAA